MDKLTEHFCISSKFGSYPVWEHLCGSVDPYMSEVTCLFLNSDLTPFPLSTCSSNYTWTSFIKMYFYFLFKIIMAWWNTYQIQRHTDLRMLATVELFAAKYVKYVSCKIHTCKFIHLERNFKMKVSPLVLKLTLSPPDCLIHCSDKVCLPYSFHKTCILT